MTSAKAIEKNTQNVFAEISRPEHASKDEQQLRDPIVNRKTFIAIVRSTLADDESLSG